MAKAKKKAAPKKEAKPRAEQYEPKVAINGSFSDVIGVAMGKKVPEKKENNNDKNMENQTPFDKEKAFKDAMQELESRNQNKFKIEDHALIMHEGELSYMNWKSDTTLDPEIRREAFQIFKSIYGH